MTPRDDGCEHSSSCCTCPLPECKDEAEIRPLSPERQERNAKITALVQAGHSKPEIARQLGSMSALSTA